MGRAFEFRKERKMKRWGKMSKTFTKIGKEIVMAVKEGGGNPESNSRLRVLIQNAKAVNMPKDNVERAIKKASSKDQSNYDEMIYEAYAQGGVAIVIETTTDNPVRTVANVRAALNKCHGSLGTQGMTDFLFERKCMFKVDATGIDPEELEFELIDAGAEEVDVDVEDNEIIIYGGFPVFGSLQKALEEKGIEIKSAEFERIPVDTKTLSEEDEILFHKLIERLEDDDDVQQVFHNLG